MRATFDERAARAAELAGSCPAARNVLDFYRRVALFQKPVFEDVSARGETDVRVLLRHFPALMELVRHTAPEPLVHFASRELESAAEQEELLVTCWERDPPESDEARFFGRALLQPYGEYLATRASISFQSDAPTCPFCNARPVVGVLRGEGDGAKRALLCSICATEWPFRRVLCPSCGSEDKDQLPVFTASDFLHVRVEACDRCKTYIKSVNLTRDGRAVPVVDELATVALNLWADEHGYTKLESNLLGL
jgi:FdhE protein